MNRAIAPLVYPTQRDGKMTVDSNQGNSPNYYPNSFLNAKDDPKRYNEVRTRIETTDVDRFESKDEDDFTQVRDFYLTFSKEERERLYTNIASELSNVYEFIQQRAIENFNKVHVEYGEGVRRAIQVANGLKKNSSK